MSIKIYKKNSEEAVEYLLTFGWNNDEYLADAKDRATIVAALKLALWRKYPVICRWRFVRVISSAWYEFFAFLSYERGKYFIDFEKRALRELGCTKVFMELDYDRLKSL
jgi:hypothetical protein